MIALQFFIFVVSIAYCIGNGLQPTSSEPEPKPIIEDDLFCEEAGECSGTETPAQLEKYFSQNHAHDLLSESEHAELIDSYVRSTSHVGIKIKNSRPYNVYYFWINNRNVGQYNGQIHVYGETATVSYIGHHFYVTKDKDDDRSQNIYEFHVTQGQNLYVVPPEDPNNPDENWSKLMMEKQFSALYKKRTGYPWLAHYHRLPPILPFWGAKYIGQKHKINSPQTYWNCEPESDSPEDIAACRDVNGEIEIELEVVALHPAAFLIMNTLSYFEADHIISMASDKLARSRAGQNGGMVSDTRTSFNTWLPKKKGDIILTTVYNRAADILGFEDYEMMSRNSEQLQVLHYDVGQEYTAHHDFGANSRDEQRAITLLFYLNNQSSPDAGGETLFPKADGKGLKVHPQKGNSAMFYSLLPDGNADDLSLHQALPVRIGEKWLCNFWIWDPTR